MLFLQLKGWWAQVRLESKEIPSKHETIQWESPLYIEALVEALV